MLNRAAAITADIIASTSMRPDDRNRVFDLTREVLSVMSSKFGAYCRVTRGDFVECALAEPQHAMRMALLLKCFVKSIQLSAYPDYSQDNRIRAFKTYGLRIAVGYGSLIEIDPIRDIIDGEAIYRAGRQLADEYTHDKERVVIKRSLEFVTGDEQWQAIFDSIFWLAEELINQATDKQSRVLYYKLLGRSEKEIADFMQVRQPTINAHSTKASWNAIERAVELFEEQIGPKPEK